MSEDGSNGHPANAFIAEDGLGDQSTGNEPSGSGTSPSIDGETQPTYGDDQSPNVQDLPNLVSKLQKQLSDKDSYISQQSNKIEELMRNFSELKGRMDGFQQPPDTSAADMEWEERVYQNVPKALKEIREEVRKEFQDKLTKKESEWLEYLEKREYLNRQWDNFYASNEHLQPFKDDLIPAVMARLRPQLKNLTLDKVFEKVKEEANRDIMKLRKKFGASGGPAPSPTIPGGKGYTRHDVDTSPDKIRTLEDLGDDIIKAHEEIVNKARGRSSVKTQ